MTKLEKLIEKGMGAAPEDLFWTGLYTAYANAQDGDWIEQANALVYAGTTVLQTTEEAA
jgi:hypothetical protein